MKSYTVAAAVLVGTLATASPLRGVARDEQSIDQWTLSDAYRTVSNDGTVCSWGFNIAQASVQEGELSQACRFNSTVPQGQDCRTTTFSNIPCIDDDTWVVNAGHYEDFIVMVLVNDDKEAQAWYGFTDQALNMGQDIPKQIKPAYLRGPQKGTPNSKRQAGGMMWTIDGLSRYVEEDTGKIIVNFGINENSAEAAHCSLRLTPPSQNESYTWSWYDRKCEDSDYSVSWGYNAEHDYAVMTLVNPQRNGNAFFGWGGLSQISDLGSRGPEPVLPCAC